MSSIEHHAEESLYGEQLRVPPHSIEAEFNVLGGLMLAPEKLPEVADWLEPKDFYRRDHQLVFQAILFLADKGQPFDPVTLGEWFVSEGQGELVGNGAYLTELAQTVFSAANLVAYAEIVLQKSKLRRAIDIGTQMVAAAFDSRGRIAEDIVGEAQHQMMALGPTVKSGPRPYRDVLLSWYQRLQEKCDGLRRAGLPTPWMEVNKAIGGLEDGMVYVLAARSNMGKTVAGLQIARFTAIRKSRVLLFEQEMTEDQVANRDMAGTMSVPHAWLREPTQGADEYWGKVTEGVRLLKEIDLMVDDTAQLTSRAMSARARREHLRKRIRLVVVDHLHEMALPGKQGEVIERAQALRDLKGLAKELGCPVLVLAQLNRGAAKPDQGAVKRPSMVDLRGSGGIEEVADVVLLLHRWDYYKADDRPGLVEVIVGKGRDVPTGTVIPLRNRFDVMRLDDWGSESWEATASDLDAANPSGDAGGFTPTSRSARPRHYDPGRDD